jgi:transposase-like protein
MADPGADLGRSRPSSGRGNGIGGRPRALTPAKRREIAESVLSGRKTVADIPRLYDISEPTVSRVVAEHHRTVKPTDGQP